jgi:hypothetical protein
MIPQPPIKTEYRHPHYPNYDDNDGNDFDMTQRGLTFDDVSDDEEKDEPQQLICTCHSCEMNSIDSVSKKYSEDRMQLREFCDVVENPNEYKKKHPNIWRVMMLFDRHCLKGRKGPPRKSPRVNNKSNVEDAVPTNNAAANQDDGNGMNQSYLQPINPAEIPNDIVLLGLAAKTQSEIDRGEPPNEAYAFFKDCLDEAYSQWRKGIEARNRKDFTSKENRTLCQIVKVSCIMVSKVLPCSIAALTFDAHHSWLLAICQDVAAAMEGAGYRFLCVKGVAKKPGHYTIQPTPAFQIASSGAAKDDAGSLRKILASKVVKVERGRNSAEAAKKRGDPTLDYIDGKLAGDDLVSNGCSESFEDIDLADVDWDKELSELMEKIDNMVQPSRFSVENDHVSAIKVLADENAATLIEFLTKAEFDPTKSWVELPTMLKNIGMCPELVAYFDVPDSTPRSGSTYRKDVANILLDVIIFMQVQCPCCNRRTSDCKTRKELRKFQYDHLKDFVKCFELAQFHDPGEDCPISTANGYCERILFECRKGRICFVACHEAGKSKSIGRHEEQLQRYPMLQIGPRPTSLYGHDNPLSLREVFKSKEFWLFVRFCYLEGFWSNTRISPKASLDKIDLVCFKLFGMLATDQMKVTRDEWKNEKSGVNRQAYATDVIAHVAARLSGKCPGCGECFLNYNAVRLRMNEWNHRIPRQGDEDSSALSTLRHNLLGWLKEAEDGDCEGTCHCCHKDVTAFQKGGDRPLWYTGG